MPSIALLAATLALAGPAAPRPAVTPVPLGREVLPVEATLEVRTARRTATAALSDAALDRLEDARGLFVAHTYLAPSVRTTHTAEHLARLVVRPAVAGRTPAGRLVLDPALDAALARIEDHVQRGRLASLTWRDAGDRLRALGDVELTDLPDGELEIRNRGAADLPGLTLSVPVPPEVELSLEGGGLLSREDGPGGARVAFPLPAGGRAVLRAMDHLVPLPILTFP